MEKMFSIGELSRLLGIPAATLRFWESQGLFSVSKGDNRYRRYSLQDVIRVADIMFYRGLGVSIKEIRQTQTRTLAEHRQSLHQLQQELSRALAAYEAMCQRTLRQQRMLTQVEQLLQARDQEEPVPFDAVAPFDYHEGDKLLQYTQDPSCYVRFFDTQDMSSERRGIITTKESGQPLLWEKPPKSRFVTFLIREKVDRDYESDVGYHLMRLSAQYRTGVLLAQYLLTATEDGQRTDYLKGYLEVFPLEQ